jgi:hypothetical protein
VIIAAIMPMAAEINAKGSNPYILRRSRGYIEKGGSGKQSKAKKNDFRHRIGAVSLNIFFGSSDRSARAFRVPGIAVKREEYFIWLFAWQYPVFAGAGEIPAARAMLRFHVAAICSGRTAYFMSSAMRLRALKWSKDWGRRRA